MGKGSCKGWVCAVCVCRAGRGVCWGDVCGEGTCVGCAGVPGMGCVDVSGMCVRCVFVLSLLIITHCILCSSLLEDCLVGYALEKDVALH